MRDNAGKGGSDETRLAPRLFKKAVRLRVESVTEKLDYMIKEGKLRAIKIGKRVVIPGSELARIIK